MTNTQDTAGYKQEKPHGRKEKLNDKQCTCDNKEPDTPNGDKAHLITNKKF